MFKLKKLVLAAAVSMSIAAPAAAESVTFGVQAPITGQYANEGQGIEKAVKLLAKQLNDKGGLLGKDVKVVACDDEGKATQAALCGRNLSNQDVFAVIGSYTSGATAASQPIFARANILQTSDGTAEQLTQHGYKLFFRNAPPNSAEAKFTGKYLVKDKGYKRIAVVSDHSSFSKGLGEAVADAIKKEGGNMVFNGFINAGSQDYRSVLTTIKSKNPDVIYFSGYYSDGGLLRAQQKDLGINADFVGGDANQNVKFGEIAGDAAAGTVIINVPAPENLPYPEAKSFLSDYKAAYGETPPSIFTLTNADGMRAIVKAVQETKSFDPDKVAGYLHGLRDFPGITGPLGFDKNGERLGSAFQAFEIQPDGSYKTIYRKPVTERTRQGSHTHGHIPAAARQRADGGKYLCPDRARLHHGLRHPETDQLRPWRLGGSGCLHRPDCNHQHGGERFRSRQLGRDPGFRGSRSCSGWRGGTSRIYGLPAVTQCPPAVGCGFGAGRIDVPRERYDAALESANADLPGRHPALHQLAFWWRGDQCHPDGYRRGVLHSDAGALPVRQ